MSYSITATLEELTKRPETKWLRMHDSSLVITYKERTFRLTARIHEDTEVALLCICEDREEEEQ